jgi:hypothetical protein
MTILDYKRRLDDGEIQEAREVRNPSLIERYIAGRGMTFKGVVGAVEKQPDAFGAKKKARGNEPWQLSQENPTGQE